MQLPLLEHVVSTGGWAESIQSLRVSHLKSLHLSTRCVFGDIDIFVEVGCQIVLDFSLGFVLCHVKDLIQSQSVKQEWVQKDGIFLSASPGLTLR